MFVHRRLSLFAEFPLPPLTPDDDEVQLVQCPKLLLIVVHHAVVEPAAGEPQPLLLNLPIQ